MGQRCDASRGSRRGAPSGLSVAARWVVAALAGVCSVAAWAAPASGEPIVIGQSISDGRGSYRATPALLGGVRAYVGRINAAGGIGGRPIKVVTLMADASPEANAENVRKLVKEEGAVAIVGCGGDAICKAMAAAATELKVPLVGSLSGLKSQGHDA